MKIYLPRWKNKHEPWYRRYSLVRDGIYEMTSNIDEADVIAGPYKPVKKDYILYFSDLWNDFDDVIRNAKIVFACRHVLYDYASKLNPNTVLTHNGTWIDSGPITDRTGPMLCPYGNYHKLIKDYIPNTVITKQPDDSPRLDYLRGLGNTTVTDWVDVHDFYKYKCVVLASEVNDYTKAQDNLKYYDGLAQGLPMLLYTNGTSFTTDDPYVFDDINKIQWPDKYYVENFRIENNWHNIFKEESRYV